MTREEAIAYLEDPFPLSNSLSIERRLELHDKALSMAIEALKANDYASERYADLCAFFSGHRNKGADILHSREEFEQWLERMRWHVEECDRLSKELDALKAQMDGDTISRQEATGIVLFECGEFKGLAETIIKRFEDLPSAQPEPCEDAVSRKLMYELGATCIARRDENGKLVALGRLDMLPSVQPDYKTDHGYIWLCPKCGVEVHSDYDRCVRCGYKR